MPDIAMCLDKECPSRVHCYRYRAKPIEYRQSYSGYQHKGEKCGFYYSTSGWDDRNLVPMDELTKREEFGKDLDILA